MSSVLRRLWWLEPACLFAVVMGSTMLAAWAQSDSTYRLYGTPKYVEGHHVLLAASAIAVFALGRQFAMATGRVPEATPQQADRLIRFWFWLTTGLTLFGYAVWLVIAIKNGFSLGLLHEFVTTHDPVRADTMFEEMFVNVKGVTTCTQFGVAAVPLGLWLFFNGQRRYVRGALLLLVAIAAARAIVLHERLAVVELIVPGAVILIRACVMGRSVSPMTRAGLQLAPVLGVISLVLFFGGFEYFRSWRYYQDKFDSYAEFTLWRVGGYYTTAHNNGAMALETQGSFPIPFATFRQLWTVPGLDETRIGYYQLTGADPVKEYDNMLIRFGTPELNNEGGLFQPVRDFGIPGYLLFWFIFGFAAGRIYRHFLVGTLAGLTLYPLVFLAILELPRFLYLSYTRSFPALVTLAIVLWLVRRAPSPEQVTGVVQVAH